MEDYDFIGTGGFILECQDGELLGVTKSQADIIKTECKFFDNFRHGTVESTQGTLRKPDWSIAIARHLVGPKAKRPYPT
jgi:hypothetical protein